MLANDSENAKARKHGWKRRYRAKLNGLKYQQSFLKEDLRFTYKGEVQVALFKEWCRELRDCVRHARLGRKKAIRIAGKSFDSHAYQFYERSVLDLKKHYILAGFFGDLFDYVFSADFRMHQRDEFDACKQDNRSVLDFLRRLQDSEIGDVSEHDARPTSESKSPGMGTMQRLSRLSFSNKNVIDTRKLIGSLTKTDFLTRIARTTGIRTVSAVIPGNNIIASPRTRTRRAL